MRKNDQVWLVEELGGHTLGIRKVIIHGWGKKQATFQDVATGQMIKYKILDCWRERYVANTKDGALALAEALKQESIRITKSHLDLPAYNRKWVLADLATEWTIKDIN